MLIARVENLASPAQWQQPYDLINAFETQTVEAGITMIKVTLHISCDEQRSRLAERLARPDKHWKYNPRDVDSRLRWDDYMFAYSAALARCSTDVAPWWVVPTDRKWYARLAVASSLVAELQRIDSQWPPRDFDVAVETERLAAS